MGLNSFNAVSFNEFLAGHKLMGVRCVTGHETFLPPRAYCPGCDQCEMEWKELSGRGRLLTFTVIYIGPAAMVAAGFDRKHPYCVGIVELEEGPRISALITGVNPLRPAEIPIGGSVTLDIQELGPEGAKRPVLAFRLS